MAQPFYIRPKAHLASEIERDVDAKTAIDWDWIDEVGKSGTGLAAEIVALGEGEARKQRRVVAFHLASKAVCIEAGTVHKIPCGDFIGIAPANAKRELSIRQGRDAQNRRIEQHGAAEILQFVS